MNDVKSPSLNGDKIFEQYPLSVNAYKQWISALPNAEVLGNDILIYDQAIKSIFYFNPRALYDFFDNLAIYIIVGNADERWYSLVTGTVGSQSGNTRIEAEEHGFNLAFETLEKQLSK